MAKSADAFRTISEVADWLDTPAHVLRFWESKFTQIKPVKRAGGRRYYRPEDMDLLGGIKALLHDQGMTIKGVQKMLREQGVKHVAGFGPGLLDDTGLIEGTVTQVAPPAPETVPVTTPKMPPPLVASPTPAKTSPDDTAAADNVVPLSPPAAANDPAPQAAPEKTDPENQGPDNRALAVAALLRDLPADPADDDFNPRSRFQAAFQRADPDKLAARAAMIAPLLTRLKDVRARMGRD